MKKYNDSISCCDKILDDYPDNADVLFDKSSSLAMLSRVNEALQLLEYAISNRIKYKIKAKNQNLLKNFLTILNLKN